MRDDPEFAEFVANTRPLLIRAFIGVKGVDDADDAAGEALAYAFEHWERVRLMDNPRGYLYRVGQSRTRRRKRKRALWLPEPRAIGVPEVEPALIPALLALPETQRTAVWLVHACGWRYSEVAEAMDTTVSMVGNHVTRALASLRRQLEVESNA